jgi:hypothetical protein
MPAVIPADGPFLDRLLDLASPSSSSGLSLQAYRTLQAAERKTAWGQQHQRTWALVEGDQLLGGATQYDLAGVLDGRAVRICGIGSVVTAPSHLDSGHARMLIDTILERTTAEGAALALFFPPRVEGAEIEMPSGFTAIPCLDVTLDVAKSPRHGAPMTMVRGGEARDLAAVVAMGQVRAEPYRFHLDRDVDFIQYVITRKRLLAGLGVANARQLQFFIAEEGTTAAAYVVLSVAGDEWTLEECGDRDLSGARIGALLQALIAREPTEHPPTIRAWLPPHLLPPQVTIASSTPSPAMVLARRLGSNDAVLSLAVDDVLYWRTDVL